MAQQLQVLLLKVSTNELLLIFSDFFLSLDGVLNEFVGIDIHGIKPGCSEKETLPPPICPNFPSVSHLFAGSLQ